MTPKQARDYLLKKHKTHECFPFGADIAVFKVIDKMFATLAEGHTLPERANAGDFYWMNLKCEPHEALILRDIFPSIIPGYHMSKVHWNTVILDGSIPQGEIERLIDLSYELVVKSLPKYKQKTILQSM
ncbi:MAG: MmcQ/YjbR family DNA-binding protein [Gammaproteobacteria bacterium]|nr:MmcQ/YjbR family DNA-binding protein [Gammaproteobacteria bacterium]NNJ71842.1 MmcQ/YjbR family DNA-binding protein [Enterobacterales bacterium]